MKGDVLGCRLDRKGKKMRFFVNGSEVPGFDLPDKPLRAVVSGIGDWRFQNVVYGGKAEQSPKNAAAVPGGASVLSARLRALGR